MGTVARALHPGVLAPRRTARLLGVLGVVLALAGGPAPRALADSAGGVVVPLVFSTPETGLAGGATAVLFRPRSLAVDPAREATDTLSLVGFYTAEQQYLAAASGRLHLAGGRWRIANAATVSEFPRDYYGLGPLSAEADEESYTPVRRTNSLRLERWIGGAWYAGVRWDAAYYRIEALDDGGQVEAYYDERGLPLRNRLHGVGATLARDTTRGGPFAPTAGSETTLALVAFPEGLGADAAFTRAELDHRQYISLGAGTTLALQGIAEHTGSDAPLPLKPRLGGAALRGFYEGRYVDELLLTGQAELRLPITGRWRGTAFAGAGDVFPSLSEATADHLKYGLGAGLRYLLVPDAGLSLRLDVARGYARGEAEDGDGVAVYFNIREAF